MTRELAFVGWEGSPPVFAGVVARNLAPGAAVGYLLHTRGRSPVVAIGDEGIRGLDPEVLMATARSVNASVHLVPSAATLALLPSWMEEDGVVLAPLPEAIRQLENACATPVRRALDVRLWVPPIRGDDPLKGRILEAIPMLPDLSVEALVRAVGKGERTVERACYAIFGCTPFRLIDRYQGIYEDFRRREGVSWDRISIEVGYEEVSSLHRARRLRRARMTRNLGRAARKGGRSATSR